MKLAIDPWNRLEKRNPPDWYRKLFIESLIDIYDNWHNLIKELNIEYYLKIWIYEPNFYNSQVVLAIGDRIPRYQKLFCDFLPIADDFQPPLFPIAKNSNRRFIWEKHYEETPCYPEDFEQQYLEDMERKGKLSYIVQDGMRLAIFREGLVYVGYLPCSQNLR